MIHAKYVAALGNSFLHAQFPHLAFDFCSRSRWMMAIASVLVPVRGDPISERAVFDAELTRYTPPVRYLIQFPAGTTSLVEQALSSDFARVRVRHADESALVFDSATQLRSADAVPYAKNVFVVHTETPRRALPAAISAIARNTPDLRPRRGSRTLGFRLMYHIDGQLVSIDPRARRALEVAVEQATGMRLTPRGKCQEFWVVGRRESSVLYFAERLQGESAPPKTRGALSTELSALLVAASKPRADDVFLDPFAGSGALIQARLRTPAQSVIYNDLDLATHRGNFMPSMNRRGKVVLLAGDALALPSIDTNSVDAIVTDPPWGEHDSEIGEYGRFAEAMSLSFARVLKPEVSRAVILINRRNEETLMAALGNAAMKIHDSYQILVNGHPATAVRASP